MNKILIVLCLIIVACARSQSGTTTNGGAAPCGTLGGKCGNEGETCSPAPIGSGWSHSLRCVSGKWQDLEIAPLPMPASS